MCIAVAKRAGIVLTRETLHECYKSNRDGAGFAYVEPAGVEPHFLEKPEVCIQKGYFDFDEFMTAFEPHKEKACLIHFRVATHREVNGINCHPWRVSDDLVFIHNGTIHCAPKDNDKLSDTGNFNDSVLKSMIEAYPEFYLNKSFKWFVENSVGSNNKLVFLDSQANFIVINESAGTWDQGVWFSNNTYKGWVNTQRIRVVESQPIIPLTPTTTTTSTTSSTKEQKEESKSESDNSTINPEDALEASELEDSALLVGPDGQPMIYDSLEELDAALAKINK